MTPIITGLLGLCSLMVDEIRRPLLIKYIYHFAILCRHSLRASWRNFASIMEILGGLGELFSDALMLVFLDCRDIGGVLLEL